MGAAAAGVVIGGTQLLSAKMQANAMQAQAAWQERQTNFNIAMSAVQRQEIEAKSENDVAMRQREINSMLGQQRVAMAANGITLDSETSLAIQEDTRRQGREDYMAIKNNAWREAWGMKVSEVDMRNQSNFAKAGGAANAATTLATGGLSAIGSVAQGAANENKSNMKKV